MALYKRGSTWWTRFSFDGKEIRRPTGTTDKIQAREYEDQLRSSLWRQKKLGERPKYIWQDAVIRWLEEKSHNRSNKDQIAHLRWLGKHLDGYVLSEISRDVLVNVSKARKSGGVSNSTVNRTLEVARAILKAAEKEWGWTDSSPKVRMLPEPKRRVRWITQDEAERLLSFLPSHTAEIARFSLMTGLRKGNVLNLKWQQVDLTRRVAWIHHDEIKTKKAVSVPLNQGAVEVIRRQLGKHQTHVFSFNGRTVKEVNTKAWRKALKSSGIKNFRWHDLRHTWASWHVQAGTSLQALQELGGWSSFEMVLRYAHLSAGHLAEYAENVRTISGTVPLTEKTN